MVNLFSTYGCFPLRLDTHGVTIIYVVDIGKGWNDVKCWRQVQNHQTYQNSYEFLQSDQIRLHKTYQINSLYHYINVIFSPLFSFFYFNIFLILISLCSMMILHSLWNN